LFVCLSVC